MKFFLSSICLSLLVACSTAVAAQDVQTDDSATTPTSRTRIVSAPFGLYKIEIPESPPPPPTSKDETGAIDIGMLGFFGIAFAADSTRQFLTIDMLDIPFFRIKTWHKGPGDTSIDIGEDWERNHPMPDNQPVDESFFSLFKYSMLSHYEEPTDDIFNIEMGKRQPYQRDEKIRILDTLIFVVYQRDSWGEEYYRNQVLDTTLTATYIKQNTPDRKRELFLKAPFGIFVGINNETNRKESFRKVQVLDLVPVLSIYESKFEMIDEKGNGNEAGDAYLLRVGKILPRSLEFYVWNGGETPSGSTYKKYVHLPILGPVWSQLDDPSESRRSQFLFPKLQFWRAPKDAR